MGKKKDPKKTSQKKDEPPKIVAPLIQMEVRAYERMRAYVDLCKDEITGFGTCSLDKKNNIISVHKIFILPQEVTAASAEIDEKDVSVMLEFAVNNDIDPETIKFWWHSHVHMDAFWSGTDQATINVFQNRWMVSLVTNKRESNLVRLDIYDPFRTAIKLDSPNLFYEKNEELNKEIRKEIDDKVTHYVSPATGHLYPGVGYGYGYGDRSGGDWKQRRGYAGSHGDRDSVRGYARGGGSPGTGCGYGGGAQSSESVVRNARYWQDQSRGSQLIN